jgi:hypothetical protein
VGRGVRGGDTARQGSERDDQRSPTAGHLTVADLQRQRRRLHRVAGSSWSPTDSRRSLAGKAQPTSWARDVYQQIFPAK